MVAVLLSAQTTDARVNMVTPELFRQGPTPEAMAELEVDTILETIRTCGLAPAIAGLSIHLSRHCLSRPLSLVLKNPLTVKFLIVS